MSSGAAMSAALTRAAQLKEGVLVAIFPDGGEKYLSTELFSKQEAEDSQQAELRFFNTLSRKKEVFRPIAPDGVTFYACGPTAHELAHLAHCRRFMVADLIHRVLTLKGYPVKFYMNFTDLDDNTIQGAERSKQSIAGFTDTYIQEFKQDMAALEVLEATGYPGLRTCAGHDRPGPEAGGQGLCLRKTRLHLF
jgi:cysteinyl-tRNA synthetase